VLNSVSLSPTLSHHRRPILLMHMTALWRQPFSGSSVPSKCEVQERTLLKRTAYSSFSSWHFPRSWLVLIFLWEHESRPFWLFLYFLRVFFTSCYAFSYWKAGVGTWVRGYVFNACMNLNACCAQKGEKSVGDPTQLWTCRRICRLLWLPHFFPVPNKPYGFCGR